jgi:hypothetical protein
VFRVPIQSRLGNYVVGFLGAIYFVSATATLIYYVVTSWGAAGLVDRVLQLALLGSAIGGVIFMRIARENLRRPPAAEKSPSSRARQADVATES